MSITAQTLEDASTKLPYFGRQVFWHIKGVEIDQNDLLTLAQDFQYPANLLPPLPTITQALRRAARVWLKQSGVPGLDDEETKQKKKLFREVKIPPRHGQSGYTGIALVLESIDLERISLSHGTHLRILYNLASKSVVVVTSASGEPLPSQVDDLLTDVFRPIFDQQLKIYTSGDVSSMLTHIITSSDYCDGIGLSANGGLYFVRRDREEQLVQFRAFVAKLPTTGHGGDPFVTAVGIIDEVEAISDMRRAVHVGIMADMAAVESRFDWYMDHRQSGTEVGLNEKITQYNDLATKVNAYADLLHMDMTDALNRLGKINARVQEMLLKLYDKQSTGSTKHQADVLPAPII